MADDQIASFLAFTSSSSEEAARQYLEMAGNDLERAVGLFMEMGGENGLNGGTGVGLGGIGPSSSNNNNVASSSSSSQPPPGSDGLDPTIDAATRAAIRAAQGPDGNNTVRAPDETRTMRLVGGDSPHRALMAAVAGPQYHPDLHDMDDIHAMGSAIWGNISNNNTNNIADVRSNINREAANRSSGTSNDDAVDLESDDSDDSYVNIDGSAIPTNNNSNNNNAPSLSAMFSPPTHLMHRAGGFQGARNVAKDARRWLLVNVQDDGDFACHALNRDVWREELVENLVREGFIFWQVMSTNPEGQTYITRYKVEGYPHLAIIDPRTGALLWRKEGWTQVNPLTAEQFVEIASDFCSRHSFSKQPAPAKHGYNSSNTQSSNKRPIQELSEEEQLQAAIRASMMPENDEMDEEGTNDVDKSMENRAENEENDDDDAKPAALNSFEQEILALEVGDEPTSGNVARIQIRMPDGKRLVRKFQGDNSVKIIYAFVAQSNEEAKSGKAFELKAKFPPQDLLSSVDESISSCGLNGEAINVMWK